MQKMARRFDHVDLRVTDFTVAGPFYRRLLPLLGFTEEVEIPGWIQFESAGSGPAEFFGLIADPHHTPNQTRIAFWAESKEDVDRLANELDACGARNVEGPGYESPTYYAVYFEDPCGNRLEICHRTQRFEPSP